MGERQHTDLRDFLELIANIRGPGTETKLQLNSDVLTSAVVTLDDLAKWHWNRYFRTFACHADETDLEKTPPHFL